MLWLLILLNYFWLSWDPDESASYYCDQHCFKIGSEVIESIWDGILVISPEISTKATNLGIPMTYRKARHAPADSLWHPLSVWHAQCRANMRRGLINAKAIFNEHARRTGKIHSANRDCDFLIGVIDSIDFNSERWKKWCLSQNGTVNKYTPIKTKPKDLAKRREWWNIHSVILKVNDNIADVDRNTCSMTEPPQCISDTDPNFKKCRVSGDIIKAYRLYYHAKTNTVKGGFRYYYTQPPRWLNVFDKNKIKIKNKKPSEDNLLTTGSNTHAFNLAYILDEENFELDSDGYVIVRFLPS